MKPLSVERMKWLLLILLLGLQALGMACSSTQQAQNKVQRQPLEKHRREYKTPATYEPRDLGYDPKTGEMITYDHKPRVELLDEKAGKYAFKWIGYDGKEKTVIFQRRDVIDVVVSASASKTADGRYLYSYEIQNLPTSATYLKRFIIQTLAADSEPDRNGAFFPGVMSSAIDEFKDGNWISFADVSDNVQIDPGQTVRVQLVSAAAPGLVECRATAETILEGPGEHMPSVLENMLPGYKEFPKGHTIGPVDSLKTLSSQDRVKYLLEKLSQFRKTGWITEAAFSRYERHLKSNDLNAVFGKIDQDLKTEQITTEVFAIIQAMKLSDLRASVDTPEIPGRGRESIQVLRTGGRWRAME